MQFDISSILIASSSWAPFREHSLTGSGITGKALLENANRESVPRIPNREAGGADQC